MGGGSRQRDVGPRSLGGSGAWNSGAVGGWIRRDRGASAPESSHLSRSGRQGVNMRVSRIVFRLGLAALLSAAAWANDAALTDDAFYANGNAGHFGASPLVNVGGPSNFLGLFQFTLGTLPAGTTAAMVSDARLRLYVKSVGTSGSVDLWAASGAWTEATVTGSGGPPPPTPGTLLVANVPVTTPNVYIQIDVTAQVKAWLNGATNNGFIVVPNPISTFVSFDSKESTSTSHPAVLEINLFGASGAAGAHGPTGATRGTGPPRATPTTRPPRVPPRARPPPPAAGPPAGPPAPPRPARA